MLLSQNQTSHKFLTVIYGIISNNYDILNTIRAIMVFTQYLKRDAELIRTYKPKNAHLKTLNLDEIIAQVKGSDDDEEAESNKNVIAIYKLVKLLCELYGSQGGINSSSFFTDRQVLAGYEAFINQDEFQGQLKS